MTDPVEAVPVYDLTDTVQEALDMARERKDCMGQRFYKDQLVFVDGSEYSVRAEIVVQRTKEAPKPKLKAV